MTEMEWESREDFKSYLRMKPAMFHEMLKRLTDRLEKTKTNWRTPLGVGLTLAVTIRYLAFGDSYRSLAYFFRMPHNIISKVVREVCASIVEEYSPEVFSTPSTPDSCRVVADRFGSRWSFHIAIKCSKDSDSLYYNYTDFFSTLLLALVDGDYYKFLWADVGTNGSASDCSVFNSSTLSTALMDNTLRLPPPESLPNDDRDTPFFLVGDDAFPLRTWMMKPFSHNQLVILFLRQTL
ncbi:protein ALP1-like [Gigantopelta aegis]|uniref:protein ALP1-like n=1 Tax=Gigantopelta aegis TaxID=1735272 RepID=UPI001B88AA22|nr:protein ALP1-like [Gigantopelta aegis]